ARFPGRSRQPAARQPAVPGGGALLLGHALGTPLYLGRDRRHAGQPGRAARRARLRQFLEIVLPLVAPTVIYFAYMLIARPRPGGNVLAFDWPWLWLGLAGVGLVIVTFVAVALFGGASPAERYEPAKVIDGEIKPGHFEPAN